MYIHHVFMKLIYLFRLVPNFTSLCTLLQMNAGSCTSNHMQISCINKIMTKKKILSIK